MKRLYSFKKTGWLLLICMLALYISSCKKLFEITPQSAFDEEYVFSTTANALTALLGAYAAMTGDVGYGSRLSFFYTCDDDAVITTSGQIDEQYRSIGRYYANGGNGQLLSPFNNLYSGIERANICIKKIPAMDKYTGGSEAEKVQLKRMYGEALTLRAQYYFELVRNWGDVPAPFVPSYDQEDLFLEKTDRDTIYGKILADLKTAIDLLPWRTEVALDERITKGAAKALRAKIALFRGGYSLRRASHLMERRDDYLTYYQIARDECYEIMQRRDQHTLNTSFLSLFKDNIDAHKLDPSGEVLFEVGLAGGTASTDGKMGYFDGNKMNGKGSRGMTIIPSYFYSFDSLDTRRDVTVATYDVDANGYKVGNQLNILSSAKFRREWITPALSPDDAASYYGINWPLIRFSDVLLMFAEAENELNPAPTGEAISAFEEVRKRAFGSNASKMGITPTDKAGFFNAIVNERSFEFGGEGIRKFDLIRWNLLGTKIDETRDKLRKMSLRQAPYTSLPTNVFTKINSTELVYYSSLYRPVPNPQPSTTLWKKISWVGTSMITENYINIVAQYYQPNHSELLPLPVTVINNNPKLKQDCGCDN